jgi:tetratricopeptide (TPR) repeat protein
VHIDKTYVDHESYFREGGEVVWDRSLGIARNTVVLPHGHELVSVNHPSQIDTEADGRIRVSFMNPSGLSVRYRIRARPLPEAATDAMRAAAAAARPAPDRTGAGPVDGYDGSYARTDRSFAERASQTREIVYFLEQPESSAFTLYHDYTESRPGRDHYLNVVRAGSAVADPRAFLLDTGEELRVETVRGDEVARQGLLPADRVDEASEVVVVRHPVVQPGASARIRIHETYTDTRRYTRAGDELVWDRSLGRSMNEVVLPQGWIVTASDVPATVDGLDDGRVRLTFWNGGPDAAQVFVRARLRSPPVASSLGGEPLYARPHPDPEALARADEALAAAPDDVEALIAAGRERRHAFRYDEAIALYSRAAERAPDDWRPWRFRGHRYLSTRRFEDGVRDLERARALAPNDFDVAYHLGLGYYLLGRFEEAADEYLRCMALAREPSALRLLGTPSVAGHRTCMLIATDPDSHVAIAEWAYRALRRAGRHGEARELLGPISDQLAVRDNGAYLQALLAHDDERSAADLALPLPAEGRFETRAYGVAVDELLDGDRERALLLLRRIAADPHWPGFGRLAAEADLARMTRPGPDEGAERQDGAGGPPLIPPRR